MQVLFYCKNQKKHVTETNWTYKACLLTEFLIPADWIIENNFCQILCLVLEILSNGEDLDCFLQHVLPKLSKKTDLATVNKKTIKGSFDLPKFSKMNISFELLKVSKITYLKSLYLKSLYI